MLKTTKKEVKERIINHIEEYYNKEELISQVEYMNYGGWNASAYSNIKELAEGGCFLIYSDDIRDFLKETLEETEEEANKYNDDKVFNLYCHLIALNGSRWINK